MTTDARAQAIITPADLILATRLMLAGPEGNGSHWRKDHYATADWGIVVPPTDPAACRWCGAGAISAVAGSDEPYEMGEVGDNALACLKSAVIEKIGIYHQEYPTDYQFLVHFNDLPETTWADMDALFRRAEEIAQGIDWS